MRTESPYLLRLAQQHEPDVVRVAFEDITDLGIAYKNRDDRKYYISISNKLPCAIRQMQAFYHELGHVMLYHLGHKRFSGSKQDRELAADVWATEIIGIADEFFRIKPGWEECKKCIDARSETCLKGKANSDLLREGKGEFIINMTGFKRPYQYDNVP